MSDELRVLRELEAAATKGPWASDATVAMHDRPDLPCVVDEHRLVVAQCWDDGHTEDECEANAALIVAMRNALPTLLAEREQQAETIARLTEHITEQIQYVEQRIADGKEIGAAVWRISLEDVARENRAALTPSLRG